MTELITHWSRLLGRLVPLACAVGLAGCAAVYSPTPMGEEPVALDPADWDGLWTAPDIGMVFRVVDGAAGEVDVLVIDGVTTTESRVLVRRSGGWLFASTRDWDEDEDEDEEEDGDEGTSDDEGAEADRGDGDLAVEDARPWVFFRVVNKGETLVLWTAHLGRFRRAIERGHLPGRIAEDEDGDPVYLGALTPEHYRVITESTHGVLMDWDEPLVLVRVSEGRPGGL